MPISRTMGPVPSSGDVKELVTEQISTGISKTQTPFKNALPLKKVDPVKIEGSGGGAKIATPFDHSMKK